MTKSCIFCLTLYDKITSISKANSRYMFEDNFEHDFEKKENIFSFNLLYFLE